MLDPTSTTIKQHDPPIANEAWTALPFPFLEMQGANVDISTTDTSQEYKGFFGIDRHPTDDGLFSPVVVISDLPTAHWATHVQLRARLAPATIAQVTRKPTDGKYRYKLSIPLAALGYVRLPDQLQT